MPDRTSFASVPTWTEIVTVVVDSPSLTPIVTTAVPDCLFAGVIATVRLAPVPPNTTLALGTSVGLELTALSVSPLAPCSASPTVRAKVPPLPVAHDSPAVTAIVGATPRELDPHQDGVMVGRAVWLVRRRTT